MIEDTEITKKIVINYDSIEEAFNRERDMKVTLLNYLQRENKYEYIDSYISQKEDGGASITMVLQFIKQ